MADETDAEHGPAGSDGVAPQVFHNAYEGQAPWDTGRPQPAVLDMIARGVLVGDVLDLGCGTGENTLQIALAGQPVLGVDLVPRAIEIAQSKADDRGVTGVEFAVANALELAALNRRFRSVLDAAVFHIFSDADRPRYANAVSKVLEPGGKLHVMVFNEHQGGGGPRRVTQTELRDTFAADIWTVESIEESHYEVRDGVSRAWYAVIQRG